MALPTLIKTSRVVEIKLAAPPDEFLITYSPAVGLSGLSNLENSQVTVMNKGSVFRIVCKVSYFRVFWNIYDIIWAVVNTFLSKTIYPGIF